MFAGNTANATEERPDADRVFTDVFEEVRAFLHTHSLLNASQLLRPEVERRVRIWSWIGALSGIGLGFIVANLPGALLGAVAGNRLGAIRDAKGKSVAAVFSELGGSQKAEVSAVAATSFSS